MQWFDNSQEQYVPQTPPIFCDNGLGRLGNSPSAVVPDYSEFSSSQESLDSQEANVPGTPLHQLNVPGTPLLNHLNSPGTPVHWSNVHRTPINQSSTQNFIRTTSPVMLNRKSHYGTPLLEIVLLKSARKHAQGHQKPCLEQQKCPATPQLEQTVPTTPKQHSTSVLTKQSMTDMKKTCENLDLFKGDEIFLK